MERFAADYTLMNEAVVDMEQILKEVVNAIDLLEEGVLRLDITWSGDANTEFMLAMLKDIDSIRSITDEMVRSKNLLRSSLTEYQATESLIQKRIKDTMLLLRRNFKGNNADLFYKKAEKLKDELLYDAQELAKVAGNIYAMANVVYEAEMRAESLVC